MPVAAPWQLQGLLEWLHLVLAPYHELIARLIAKEHTHCCELLGHEPSNIVVPFSKDQQHWLWQFSYLWQSALTNFPGQVREHLPYSKLYSCLPLHAWFSKNYPPFYQRLSQFLE
jgi:hypothetical protein